jgi:hypothetical protein
MNLRIIPSSQINTDKWDACVKANVNGLIYASSDYLNAMTDNWSGLIIDDYTTIMPLPWRKKWGITYLYTPPFTQQLGLIGFKPISSNQLNEQLTSFAKYGDYLFNDGNTALANSLGCTLCNNYVIDLEKSYEEIKATYKKSFQKNVNRASRQELFYSISTDIDEAIALFYQYNKPKINHVEQSSLANFNRLCKQCQLFDKVIIRRVTNAKGALMSIVLLLTDDKRYYNIINYTSEAGRQCEANYFLYDNVFRELAGNNKLFDFEGSDLSGVKAFYESMGGVAKPYSHWHFNELPWLLKLIKK